VTDYKLVKVLSEDLVGVTSSEHGRQLWQKVKLRKQKRCTDCGVYIPKGTVCWSPITHQLNRMHRIHIDCLKT